MAFFSSGWFGSLLGLAGILLSLYFYLKGKIGARLDYQMAEVKILDHNNLAEGMEVTFFNKPIEKLVRTQVVIWNSGRKTIEGNKIVSSDPLRLFFDNSEVLSCNTAFYSREINKCAVFKDEGSNDTIIFKFDFLDPQDGVVIDILHTGKETCLPKFHGNIKGMKDKIRDRGRAPFPIIEFMTRKSKVIIYLIWIASFIVTSLLIIGTLFLVEFLSEDGYSYKIATGLGLSSGIFLSVNRINFLKRRKAPRTINKYSFEER